MFTDIFLHYTFINYTYIFVSKYPPCQNIQKYLCQNKISINIFDVSVKSKYPYILFFSIFQTLDLPMQILLLLIAIFWLMYKTFTILTLFFEKYWLQFWFWLQTTNRRPFRRSPYFEMRRITPFFKIELPDKTLLLKTIKNKFKKMVLKNQFSRTIFKNIAKEDLRFLIWSKKKGERGYFIRYMVLLNHEWSHFWQTFLKDATFFILVCSKGVNN